MAGLFAGQIVFYEIQKDVDAGRQGMPYAVDYRMAQSRQPSLTTYLVAFRIGGFENIHDVQRFFLDDNP